MTKFASVKKLIDLKRKQRHIIRSFWKYDNVNSYAADLWIVSVQVKKKKGGGVSHPSYWRRL